MELILPIGLRLYERQVAGHGFSQQNNNKRCKSKPQLLHSPSERCIYKPVQDPPKGDREIQFYQEVFSESLPSDTDGQTAADSSSAARGLLQFMPTFGGVYCSNGEYPGCRYLRLGDLLHDFVRPSVMDLKIGARSFEPGASERKQAIERAKYQHREGLGFFVTGLRVWREEAQQYEYFEKRYWTEVTPDNVHARVLPPLLSSVPTGPQRRRAARHLLDRLECLAAWFERQTAFHFYASSILLAVESCPAALDDDAVACFPGPSPKRGDDAGSISPALEDEGAASSQSPSPTPPASPSSIDPPDDAAHAARPVALVAMVDFTHTLPGNGQLDENYLVGLRSIVRLLREYERELAEN